MQIIKIVNLIYEASQLDQFVEEIFNNKENELNKLIHSIDIPDSNWEIIEKNNIIDCDLSLMWLDNQFYRITFIHDFIIVKQKLEDIYSQDIQYLYYDRDEIWSLMINREMYEIRLLSTESQCTRFFEFQIFYKLWHGKK